MSETSSQNGPRPPFAPASEAPTRKAPRLADYAPHVSGDVDALIAAVRERDPEFAGILDAKNDQECSARVAALSSAAGQRIFLTIAAVGFHLQKVARHDEALMLENIALAIVMREPADRLDCFAERTQPRNRGDVLFAIGRIYVEQGNLSAALASYMQAEKSYQADAELRAKHGVTKISEFDRVFHQQDFRSQLYSHMAGVYRRLGDEAAATEFTRKAFENSQLTMQPSDRAFDMLNRARGAKDRGDLDAALGWYWKMLAIALASSDSQLVSRDVALALSGAAKIYATLGLNRRALELYKRSIDLNSRANNRERLLENYRELAEVHTARQDVDGALAACSEALICCSIEAPAGDISRDLRWDGPDGKSRLLVRLDEAWDILFQIARTIAPRDRDAAIEHLKAAVRVIDHLRGGVVDDERRTGLQIPFMPLYDLLIDLLSDSYRDHGNPAVAEALFTAIDGAKSRVLAEMLAAQTLRRPNGVDPELIEQETALLSLIRAIEDRLKAGAGDAIADLHALEEANTALDRLWSRIAETDTGEGGEYVSLRRARSLEPAELRTLLQETRQAVVTVNYYATPTRLVIVVVYSDRPEIEIETIAVGREAIREMMLVNPSRPPPSDLRVPYWQLDFVPLVVNPIRRFVKGYDCICLVPHDALHSLPIHALAGVDDHTPALIEQAEVCFIPSASLLRYCLRKPMQNDGNNLVLGNPVCPNLPAIPQTAEEARRVAAIIGCNPLMDEAATRQALLSRSPAAEYIHIACHNEFSPDDPLGSGLMLSDGKVTVRDLLGLHLHARIVVLSACHSGAAQAGPGDELIGCVRALMFAGAASTVVSLWNTYDESAARLMEEFYLALKAGARRGAALAQAQRKLFSSGVSLAKWAPFVLIGDWR